MTSSPILAMVVISSVPHFFEPSASHPTVPLLTAHTEFGKAPNTSLKAQELPIPLKLKIVQFITAAGSITPTTGDDHSMDSLLSSDNSDSEDSSGITIKEEDPPEDNLIPKPEGEND